MQVLEFGRGTGSTAIAHALYVKHIHATDVSSKMFEITQGKADANGTQKAIEPVVEEFLGRPSNNEAYVRSLGLE